jgi:ribosomal protein S18 acetylase RimI-like enzyme
MDIVAWLYPATARALARWGELGCEDLLQMSLAAELPPARPVAGIELRLATEADLDAVIAMYAADPWLYLADLAPDPDDPAQVRGLYLDRLRRGELCFLAMRGDQIAHINWSCYRWGDVLPDQPLRLRPGEVYTTDAITAPAFRGQGLHTLVLRAMLAHARDRGIRRALTLARADRDATFKALREVGYRKCGRLIYFLPKGKHRAWILSRQGDLEPLFRQP